jgi:hypothetical protein
MTDDESRICPFHPLSLFGERDRVRGNQRNAKFKEQNAKLQFKAKNP